MKVTEPASSVGVASLIKIYGLPFMMGLMAAALGLALLPPKNWKEMFLRSFVTVTCSVLLGLPLYDWLCLHYEFIAEARHFEPLIYVAAGLPAWWVLGAIARYLDGSLEELIKNIASKWTRNE